MIATVSAEDPGLDFTTDAVRLVHLRTWVGEFFHMFKFMFSTTQMFTINYCSRYFHKREDKEKDVSRYWVTLRKGLALEDAVDLSQDRLENE
jgi:hypothetical protein